MNKKFNPDRDVAEWTGRQTPYDILKEGTIALVVIGLLTVVLALVFSSPDERAITIKTWSNADPVDFAQTAFSELAGTSAVAQYGAPYNTAATGQQLGPLKLAKWIGVHIPINTVKDFVITPLSSLPSSSPLSGALTQWKSTSPTQHATWIAAFTKVADKISFQNGQVQEPTSNSGPIPVLINSETQMARSGALDQALVTGSGFYTMNYTKPLLFVSDGGYMAAVAQKQHLLGSQWGMMNETGSYPGQAWLWLYTFWYQIQPFASSSNADVLVWGMMMVLTILLALVPFIPGLRSIPRKTKIYRLIWREHYRELAEHK